MVRVLHFELKVGPVEVANEDFWFLHVQLVDNVLSHFQSSSRSESQNWDIRIHSLQSVQLQVALSEVLAPGADTVSFINYESLDSSFEVLFLQHILQPSVLGQFLRSYVYKLCLLNAMFEV